MRHIEWLLPAAEVRSSNPDISKFLFGSLFFLHSIETTKITKKRPGLKKMFCIICPCLRCIFTFLSLSLSSSFPVNLPHLVSIPHSLTSTNPRISKFWRDGLGRTSWRLPLSGVQEKQNFQTRVFFCWNLVLLFYQKSPHAILMPASS